MNAAKLCKDCRWCVRDTRLNGELVNAQCASPKTTRRKNFVDGASTPVFVYCETHRDFPFLQDVIHGTCGKRGRFFEPKSND